MRISFSHLACLVAATSLADASKTWYKKTGNGPPGNPLLARQSDDDSSCDGETCAECYGAGNIVCSADYCFNPDGGEQCCADGNYCVGSDTSCCGAVGPGVTGGPDSDEPTSTSTIHITTTSTASRTSSATATSSADDEWDCLDSDSGEKCCQRGGDENHWCYGFYPTSYCYRPTMGEVCCSDGSVCDSGADCCSDSNAIATTPNPEDSAPSTTPSASASRSASRSGNASAAASTSDSLFVSSDSTTSATRTRSTAFNTSSASATTTGPEQVTANAAPARAEGMFAALGVVGAGLALL